MKRAGLRLISLSLIAVLGAACAGPAGTGDRVRVVASFYPLAWAAQQVGREHVAVDDLTPPGGEAHDLQLTARQRSVIQGASLVLLLGKGFQPEVEQAAKESRAKIVDLLGGLTLLPPAENELGGDPHVWLDPVNMQAIAAAIARALAGADPEHRSNYEANASAVATQLGSLDESYRSALSECKLKTIVTTHEAFAYLAARYELTQVGLTGQTPEAEPSAAKIQAARQAARRGQIGAIFFEATDEGRRSGTSIAGDLGLPALGLNTLESNPRPRDYLSQMSQNLDALKQGLACS